MISRQRLEDYAVLTGIKLGEPVEYKIDLETQAKTKKLVQLMLDANKNAGNSKLTFK